MIINNNAKIMFDRMFITCVMRRIELYKIQNFKRLITYTNEKHELHKNLIFCIKGI